MTCVACAALSLIPSFMLMGKEIVKDIAWKPNGSEGNHVVTPANTADKHYAEVDTSNEDGPVDPTNP